MLLILRQLFKDSYNLNSKYYFKNVVYLVPECPKFLKIPIHLQNISEIFKKMSQNDNFHQSVLFSDPISPTSRLQLCV